jgi:hypothetical protein
MQLQLLLPLPLQLQLQLQLPRYSAVSAESALCSLTPRRSVCVVCVVCVKTSAVDTVNCRNEKPSTARDECLHGSGP